MFSILKISFTAKNVPFVLTRLIVDEQERNELKASGNMLDSISLKDIKKLGYEYENSTVEIIDLTPDEAQGYLKVFGEKSGFDTYFLFNNSFAGNVSFSEKFLPE